MNENNFLIEGSAAFHLVELRNTGKNEEKENEHEKLEDATSNTHTHMVTQRNDTIDWIR